MYGKLIWQVSLGGIFGEQYTSNQMLEVKFTHFSSIVHFPSCSSSLGSQSKQNLDVKDLCEAEL